MNMGMKLMIGSDPCTPSRLAPTPFWNTSTTTP